MPEALPPRKINPALLLGDRVKGGEGATETGAFAPASPGLRRPLSRAGAGGDGGSGSVAGSDGGSGVASVGADSAAKAAASGGSGAGLTAGPGVGARVVPVAPVPVRRAGGGSLEEVSDFSSRAAVRRAGMVRPGSEASPGAEVAEKAGGVSGSPAVDKVVPQVMTGRARQGAVTGTGVSKPAATAQPSSVTADGAAGEGDVPKTVDKTTGKAAAPSSLPVRPNARRINPRFMDPTPVEANEPEAGATAEPGRRAARPGLTQRPVTRFPSRQEGAEKALTSAAVQPRFSLRDAAAEQRRAQEREDALELRGSLRDASGKFISVEDATEEDVADARARTTRPQFLGRGGKQRYVPPSRAKVSADAEVESWGEDTSNDPRYGLGAENKAPDKKATYGKGFKVGDRDIIMLKFLTRYRYANAEQLARLVDTSAGAITQRLVKLEARGLVRRQVLTERQYLWMTTKAGNLLIDSSFAPIRSGLSYATIAHTLGLANLGKELEREAGGKDLLGERDDPDDPAFENRWKFGIWGHPRGRTMGEMTVTEREIRQGQMRWRGNRSTLEMRELVDLAVAAPEAAPELEEGNEGLFVVYGANGQDTEHIPDLVVARERGANGEPKHIAIELELTAKPLPSWKRILRWYRDNGVMYDKVYYFTHKRSIANALQQADKDVGLGDRLVIRKYNLTNGRLPFWG